MFCVKCGSEIKDNAKFCMKCGAQISNETAQGPAVKEQVPASTVQVTQTPMQAVATPAQQSVPAKKKNGGLFGIIALAVIALALAAVVIWVAFLQPKKDAEEANSNTVKQEQQKEEKGQRDQDKGSSEEASQGTDSEPEEKKVYSGAKTDINIQVRQIDNASFPEMTLYASVTDKSGNAIQDLGIDVFEVQEIDGSGNVSSVEIADVYQVLGQDKISVNLVLDASGSMDSQNKMRQAKNAATTLLGQMQLDKGDRVEIISFDDFVYLEHEFSSDQTALEAAIDNIDTDGMTALYDALYAGLFQTYYEKGAKCVIGFTDGLENASSYSFNDVVQLAQSTGIPVYIIGIGNEYDAAELQDLADLCSGKYYSAAEADLQAILEDIYLSIYKEQQDYYVIKYRTPNEQDANAFREVVLGTSDYTEYNGTGRKSYVPKTDISGAFSDSYMQKDFIIEDSSQRQLTESDLAGLSLAELRIARNEIFARHGRQFKDAMLNQWFYSKTWYLNMPKKYAPADFDAISPSPLSRLESDNANFIREYENNIMSTRDIYPNAGSVLLSDYDLALSKAVLKTALAQMQGYPSTDILSENIRMVQEAINKEDVQY